MHWTDALDNPQAVAGLFDAPASLGEVELFDVALMQRGELTVHFAVARSPDRAPRRWPSVANTTHFWIEAWGLRGLAIDGWGLPASGTIDVDVGPDGLRRLRIDSPPCRLRVGFESLRVARVEGIHASPHAD